jgi:hypothetical protein
MITPGTILIEKDTIVPTFFRIGAESYPNAWMRAIRNPNIHESEKELATAGWTFFYMAGEIRAIAFGFDKQKMLDAALRRLIAKVRMQKCNCLEVDEVSTHSFLGMPYVSISAHSRHIQTGSTLDQRHKSENGSQGRNSSHERNSGIYQ